MTPWKTRGCAPSPASVRSGKPAPRATLPSKNGGRLLRDLERKAAGSGLPLAAHLVYALCAREEITHLPADRDDIIVVTAADIFT